MRVRYQMVDGSPMSRCDLTEPDARRLYKNLFSNGLCMWAELVGEEEDNYMDVLESFDHEVLARSMEKSISEILANGFEWMLRG